LNSSIQLEDEGGD